LVKTNAITSFKEKTKNLKKKAERKMKKMSLIPTILIILLLTIFSLSIASTVQATDESSKVTFRPLDHWTYWNPSVIIPSAWAGYEPGSAPPLFEAGWYGIFFSFSWYDPPNAPVYPDPLRYDGYIEERELHSGETEITVYIHFQDLKILYVRAFPDPHPLFCDYNLNIFTEDLTMSGIAITKFIFYSLDEWPYPYLPNLNYMVYFGLGEVLFHSITASGFGTLSDHATTHGFTPGATAKVTLVERALYRPPIQEYPDDLGMWPAEILNIQEL
jgi:hypothetical protein